MSVSTSAYRTIGAAREREELILSHLPLVQHIVGRMTMHLPPGVDRDNLRSAGVLGLVEAAGKFDPVRGIKFETFASWRIRGAVLDELRRNCPVPQQLLEKAALVRKARREISEPDDLDRLAETTGLSTDDVADALAALRLTRWLSWETLVEGDPGRCAVDPGPSERAELEDQKRLLAEGITTLPEKQRLVVTLYYMENLRLREIAEVLHLSESRVSRLLQRSLLALEKHLRARNGED